MKHKISLGFVLLGLVLLLAAAALTGYFLLENRAAEKASAAMAEQFQFAEVSSLSASDLPPSRQEIPDYQLNPNMEMPVATVNGYDCIGVIDIPGLNRRLPVLSTWSYDLLRVAPCRYDGSAYTGDLIIAAHNYRAHFGSLSTLQIGDRVSFTDADGHVFSYDVTEVGTINPDATKQLLDGNWDLTLFTCTLGNTYRVVVRCRLLPNS